MEIYASTSQYEGVCEWWGGDRYDIYTVYTLFYGITKLKIVMTFYFGIFASFNTEISKNKIVGL